MIIIPHNKITVLGAELKKCVQVELQTTLTKDRNLMLWISGTVILRNADEGIELSLDKPFAGGFHPTIIDCQLKLSEIFESLKGQSIERIGDQLINIALLKCMTIYFRIGPEQEIDHSVWLKKVSLDGVTLYKDQAPTKAFFDPRQF